MKHAQGYVCLTLLVGFASCARSENSEVPDRPKYSQIRPAGDSGRRSQLKIPPLYSDTHPVVDVPDKIAQAPPLRFASWVPPATVAYIRHIEEELRLLRERYAWDIELFEKGFISRNEMERTNAETLYWEAIFEDWKAEIPAGGILPPISETPPRRINAQGFLRALKVRLRASAALQEGQLKVTEYSANRVRVTFYYDSRPPGLLAVEARAKEICRAAVEELIRIGRAAAVDNLVVEAEVATRGKVGIRTAFFNPDSGKIQIRPTS